MERQNMYNRSMSFKVLFESHLIYKWRYYRQSNFNQLNIMVPYVDIIGLCHSVAILWDVNGMWGSCASISSACYLRYLVNTFLKRYKSTFFWPFLKLLDHCVASSHFLFHDYWTWLNIKSILRSYTSLKCIHQSLRSVTF